MRTFAFHFVAEVCRREYCRHRAANKAFSESGVISRQTLKSPGRTHWDHMSPLHVALAMQMPAYELGMMLFREKEKVGLNSILCHFPKRY